MKSNNKGFTLIELLAVIVILAIILIIAIPAVGNIIKESKENAYEDTTKLIERAARIYIGKNPNQLPESIGEKSEITIKTLVDNNLLESIPKDPRTGELLDELSTIEITKTGDNKYTYVYGDEDISVLLVNKFLENVGSNGTYELKNEGTSNEANFFVGRDPNNWIEFGKDGNDNALMWRIIKMDEEGIKIIYEGVKNGSSAPTANGRITINGSLTTPWDEGGGTFGSNKWERPADLKAKLATWYDSLKIDESYINPIKWCLGASGHGINYPTNQVPTSHFLSSECVDGTYDGGTFKGKTDNSIGYGLIRVSDYLSASSAETCTGSYFDGPGSSTVDNGRHCGRITDEAGRTNYLWKSAYSWWTFTARATASYSVWSVDSAGSVGSSGHVTSTSAHAPFGVRPVLNLKSDILFNNGSGTLASPYTVKQ